MAVVVVESPAKAKTINKYLGNDYFVIASYGHVRDLPPKDGSVDPDNDFHMLWEVASTSKKHVKAISDAVKDDNHLILATDPDREGEAISWHILDLLKARKVIKKDTKVERVVFNSITKTAVTAAMENPRMVDMELVDAYLARRALDYLVGFKLSPVLWRKLPGSRSAGRVQSVALRLITDREDEIDAFDPQEYWSITADFDQNGSFTARLATLDGTKTEKFSFTNEADAKKAEDAVKTGGFAVTSVEAKPAVRKPSAPFMTSTLQQEASRKFGFGARQTMSAAQRLYEAGLITYMRTDGIDMAGEAIAATRGEIETRFGKAYVPKSPRAYKNKAKNAQEAHECIRPTNMGISLEELKTADPDQRKVYDLIWKRTMACQMAEAEFERTTVMLKNDRAELRASGQVVKFDGFLKIYFESRDDIEGDEDDSKVLPPLAEGDRPTLGDTHADQHFTQPPARYSEASLIRKMEELGIGRPSTYASIVTTIQDRDYVRKDGGRLIPEDKGRLVTLFLSTYFPKYVSYDFTAELEEDLDRIAGGDRMSGDVLGDFWRDFSAALGEVSELRITDVINRINEVLAPKVFPPREDGKDPRACTNCDDGILSVRFAKNGDLFVGCSNYPDCRFTRPVDPDQADDEIDAPDGKTLGYDGEDRISLRKGRFGPYVQRGEGETKDKPPRSSVPKGMELSSVGLERAVELLSLPRPVGAHPEDGETIEAGIGRYGPFIRHGKTYANIKDPEEVFSIGINRAVELIAEKASRGRGARKAAEPLRVLGDHPDGGQVALYDGRYGPYVKWEKVNASLPKDRAPEGIELEEALELVNAKAASKGKRKTAKKPAAKKTATKKPAAKKAPAKTTTTKATAAKKTAAKKTTTKVSTPKTAPAKSSDDGDDVIED